MNSPFIVYPLVILFTKVVDVIGCILGRSRHTRVIQNKLSLAGSGNVTTKVGDGHLQELVTRQQNIGNF